MRRFNIKQNDTSPSILVQLLDENGNPKNDIGMVETIEFHMMNQEENTVVSDTATVINEDEAKVSYNWKPSDTEKHGKFRAEFEVVYQNNGGRETFPNDGYIDVIIDEDIA
jgi:hypothetical protein